MTTAPTVLLIEGGWSGPWGFAQLTAALAQRGVSAVTLPAATNGTRTWRPTLTSAEAHERVRSAIRKIDGRVVLAAHSGGGYEMTSCGDELKVEHLVYMSALMPGSEITPDPGHLRDSSTRDAEGFGTYDRGKASEFFFGELLPDEQEWTIRTLIPGSTTGEPAPPVAEPAFKIKPSSYIVFEQDRALLPDDQNALASLTGAAYRVDAAHFGFMSQPDVVAEILAAIAKDL